MSFTNIYVKHLKQCNREFNFYSDYDDLKFPSGHTMFNYKPVYSEDYRETYGWIVLGRFFKGSTERMRSCV